MRYSIRAISTLTACLSFTSLAVAQTTTPQETSRTPAVVDDSPGNPPKATLPPQPPTTESASPAQTAPATPVMAPSASQVGPSASTASSPMPPVPMVLKVRTDDCTSKWTRGGFYMRVASGIGDTTMTGTGPKGTASISGLGSNSLIALGGGIARGLVLAGTLQTSTVSGTFNGGPFVDQKVTSNGQSLATSSKADATAVQLGVLADWYPNPSDGWHVGLSAGVGVASVKNHADDSTLSGNGTAGSFFAGYDWAIGPSWSLGLALVAGGTLSTSLKYASDHPDTGYKMKSYSVGISGSFLYF